MKKIIILHSYPNTPRRLKVLSECIDIFKKTDYDVFLVSHYPVPSEVYKKAHYYLFDEDNSMLPGGEFLTQHYMYNSNYKAILASKGHALAISRSIKKSVSFVKNLDYDFFWFCEADCLMSDEDLIKFDSLRESMFSNNKHMVYFKPNSFRDQKHGSLVYETVMFGGKPNYMLNKFSPPTSLEEWKNLKLDPMLEYVFYEKFRDTENEYIIIDDHSSNYFNTSKINVFYYREFVCDILKTESENSVVLFTNNSNISSSIYTVVIKLNGVEVNKDVFCRGCWQYKFYDLDGSSLELDIYEDDVYAFTKEYKLTKDVEVAGIFELG